MAACTFQKVLGGTIVPADDETERFLARIKAGEGFTCEVKRSRNVRFHRKMMALLQLAFDIWTPPPMEHRGAAVTRDFEAFREHVLILAGHYDAVYNLDGSLRLKVRSISFAALDEDGFAELYPQVFDVIWDKVMSTAGYSSKDELERVVMQVLSFN